MMAMKNLEVVAEGARTEEEEVEHRGGDGEEEKGDIIIVSSAYGSQGDVGPLLALARTLHRHRRTSCSEDTTFTGDEPPITVNNENVAVVFVANGRGRLPHSQRVRASNST